MVQKKLYRSKDKILGGVCAGIGEYLDVDPTIVRLLWAVITIVSVGVGLIAYLLAWIIIPEKHPGKAKEKKKR